MEDLNKSDIEISNQQKTNLNIFWIGYVIYVVGYCLASTLLYISIVQLQALQFIGFLLFMYALVNILKFKIKDTYLRNLFIVYFIWLMGVMMRGISFDFGYIKGLIFDPGYGILIYFVPLILLFPQNFAFYKKLFDVILIFGLLYVLCSTIFIKHVFDPDRRSTLSQGIVENFSLMSYPVGFMLLTYLYHIPKKRFVAFGIMMLMLLIAVYRARRGMIFMCVTTLLFYLMVYLIVSKRTFMVVYLAIIIAIIGALYYSSLYNQSNFGMFNFLIERGDEDTRTGVEVAFNEDMTATEWWVGKGIKGEYYCPNIDALDDTGYRSVIETGYLQIILKGGIISLVLLLLILVPAVIKGLFSSKNTFSKAAALWILLWIFYLYPTVSNSFSLHYMIVWLSVGICYSKKIRNLTDGQIKLLLAETKKTSTRPKFQPRTNQLSAK